MLVILAIPELELIDTIEGDHFFERDREPVIRTLGLDRNY